MSYQSGSDWFCCRNSLFEGEKAQEQLTKIYCRSPNNTGFNSPSNRDIDMKPSTSKTIYSFKEHPIRVLSYEKQTSNQVLTQRSIKNNEKMVSCSSFRKHNLCFSPEYLPKKPNLQIKELYSPRVVRNQEITSPHFQIQTKITPKMHPRSYCQRLSPQYQPLETVRNMKSPSKLYSNLYSLKIQSQKPILKFSPKLIESKMKEKRIKTAEEETQYSSMHSQIHFRNSYEGSETTGCHSFQKKNCIGQGNFRSSVFQDDNQKSQYNPQIQFPSCKEVSACQQFDHSISNEFLRNARSINSIVTSTQVKSKRTSREPSNVLNFRTFQCMTPLISPRQSEGTPECLTKINQKSERPKQERVSTRCQAKTPRTIISPVKKTSLGFVDQQLSGEKINSSIFYLDEQTIEKCEPKKISYMSVLNINDQESSQEEELKDVVDEKINISNGLSGDNSIFMSARNSLKYVEDQRSKKIIHQSPNIEKYLQQDLLLLKDVQYRQKRTNTILSIQSVQSENSCLDIKFMQKHRTRREISKLIRQ